MSLDSLVRRAQKPFMIILLIAIVLIPISFAAPQPAPNADKKTGDHPPASLLEMVSYSDLFYPHGQFVSDIVIPNESLYFQPGIGLDLKSGMPYDHLRIRLDKGQIYAKPFQLQCQGHHNLIRSRFFVVQVEHKVNL